jgi:hypothetical protein
MIYVRHAHFFRDTQIWLLLGSHLERTYHESRSSTNLNPSLQPTTLRFSVSHLLEIMRFQPLLSAFFVELQYHFIHRQWTPAISRHESLLPEIGVLVSDPALFAVGSKFFGGELDRAVNTSVEFNPAATTCQLAGRKCQSRGSEQGRTYRCRPTSRSRRNTTSSSFDKLEANDTASLLLRA